MPRNNYIRPTKANLKSAVKTVAKIPAGLARKVFSSANVTDVFPKMKRRKK